MQWVCRSQPKPLPGVISATSERSQQLREVPVTWKRASVLPIFSKGNKEEDLQTNRPESQLTLHPWAPLPNT